MSRQPHRNPDCSVFIGNLDQRVTEELLWELFLQAGPVQNIHIPCDKETGKQKAFGFVEFSSSASAHYAWELLDGIKLFNRELTVRPQQKEGQPASQPSRSQMPANRFYEDFYNKYDELKRRPQSEPRRGRWEDNYSHNQNRSFSQQPLHRSFSSPAQPSPSASPYSQPMWQSNPFINRRFMESPILGNPMFQNSPSHHRHR